MKNSNQSAGECREGGCARPPAEPKHLLASGQGSSADLVKSGVGNLIGINPRSSVNQLLQDLGHFCVRPAVIGVGTFLVVPQTHAESFLSGRGNERDFILKPFLFLKHGDDLLFQLPGKLRGAVGLQLQGYAACIHVVLLLGREGQGGISDDRYLSSSDQKTPPVHCKNKSLNLYCQELVYDTGHN